MTPHAQQSRQEESRIVQLVEEREWRGNSREQRDRGQNPMQVFSQNVEPNEHPAEGVHDLAEKESFLLAHEVSQQNVTELITVGLNVSEDGVAQSSIGRCNRGSRSRSRSRHVKLGNKS